MQSEGNANHFVSICLNFGITVLCVFPTWLVLSALEGSHEENITSAERDLGDAGEEEIGSKAAAK